MFLLKKLFGIFSSTSESAGKTRGELPPELEPVREQMEFYFSPSNVEYDAYMKALIDNDAERYISVEEFAKFNRIKSLEVTNEEILRACDASEELEVDFEKQAIRSIVPFKSDPRRICRTLNIRGFESNETLETLRAFFGTIIPKVLRIEMRNRNKGQEKFFSGEVNVELQTEEEAQEILKKGITYKGQPLRVELLSNIKKQKVFESKNPGKNLPRPSKHTRGKN